MSIYAYADLVRSIDARRDADHLAGLARVRAEIAADERARADRAADIAATARRNSRCKVVRQFRAVLARFEREAPNTDEADDVMRLVTRTETTLRNGGEVEGLSAITCEMLRLMP